MQEKTQNLQLKVQSSEYEANMDEKFAYIYERFERGEYGGSITPDELPFYKKYKFEKSDYPGAFGLFDAFMLQNVQVIFGYPGGAILPIYDELFFWEENGLIKHYLVRHEQGAVHAADGYARSTGKVGVCMATSGPGATNLVTGIATAFADSIPLVVITGQVARFLLGTDAFQEIDTIGITMPIVKHSYLVKDPHEINSIVMEAFYIAENGRPGPVVIDIPKDVGQEIYSDYLPTYKSFIRDLIGARYFTAFERSIFEEAIAELCLSLKPLLYVGGGAISSDATLTIMDLAEVFDVPLTTTLMGKGIFDEDHELSLGMLGMHGTAYANMAVGCCQLLVAIGARFDDRVTGNLDRFAFDATVIHIDVDPAEINKNRKADIRIVGNIASSVRVLVARRYADPYLHELTTEEKIERDDWIYFVQDYKEAFPLVIPVIETKVLSPQRVINQVGQFAKYAFFTTDVGQHQMWAAQFIKCGPRRWISSAGLGTMGYGVPAAIGVQIAYPNEQVICISGDSSFQMNLQELGTISQYNLPIKIFVVNNNWQGMVRQWQQSFFESRYSHSNMSQGAPNLLKLGNAYKIRTVQLQTEEFLNDTIIDILNYNGPVLTEFCVLQNENCYPMMMPGSDNKNLILNEQQNQELIEKKKAEKLASSTKN